MPDRVETRANVHSLLHLSSCVKSGSRLSSLHVGSILPMLGPPSVDQIVYVIICIMQSQNALHLLL